MNEKAIEIAEGEVNAAVTFHLNRIERQLGQRGIRVERKPISRSGTGERYESEICIYFWRGQELIDALEFHVARDGEIVTDKAEADSWLVQQLGTILKKV